MKARGLAVAAALAGLPLSVLAQIAIQRTAPAGFAAVLTPTVERVLHFDGETYSGIVLVTGSAGSNSVVIVPASIDSLEQLVVAQGIHARAAKLWAESAEFVLGRITCLPAAMTARCLPARFEARGSALYLMIDAPRDRAEDAGNAIASLGSIYAAAGVRYQGDAKTLSLSAATQGMVSLRDTYLEYDVYLRGSSGSVSDTGSAGFASPVFKSGYNLLVAGTPMFGGARAFAGLFRAGGLGGDSTASQFFARPKLIGVAMRSDDSPLQAGGRSRVLVTLTEPARITLLSDGVQVYSGLHGIGEQSITIYGRTGNFVDVVTQDMAGRQSRFQVPAAGIDGIATTAKTAWSVEIGTTSNENDAFASSTRGSPRIASLQGQTRLFGRNVQGGVQAATGGFARMGLSANLVDETPANSAVNKHGRGTLLSAAGMLGRYGEYGISATGSGQWREKFNGSVIASSYRPPSSPDGVVGQCNVTSTLCYAKTHYSRLSVNAGLESFPVQFGWSAGRSITGYSRQILIQGSSRLGFVHTALSKDARVTWGARHDSRSGLSLFAHLSYPLGKRSTVVASVSASPRGTDISSGYSHQFDDDGGWLESIYEGVQKHMDNSSAPLAFIHQVTGRTSATVTNLSASHSGESMDILATLAAGYGVSPSGLALTHQERGESTRQFTTLSPNAAFAALKIVNESLDPQIAILGWRNIEIPPQSSVLLAIPAGYAPDVSISPGPVTESLRANMPDYLFAGNVKEIRVTRGNWLHVSFLLRSPNDTSSGQKPLRAEYTRAKLSDEPERLYQDSSGFSFVFEPARGSTMVRYITTGAGMAETTYRCEASQPMIQAEPGIYLRLSYLCEPASAKPAN